MANFTKIFAIRGVVQHYNWGGNSFIPNVLKQVNNEGKPFAEYWMGAHDNAPSALEQTGNEQRLNTIIAQHPEYLGEHARSQFGRLPYLLKILDVKDMLSIQVHPSKAAAELEFAEEEKKGIARNAANRNYKDDNHKPELMLALSEFYLLHGFRPAEQMKSILNEVTELNFLTPVFGNENYRELYQLVMEMPQEEVNQRLQPLLDRILPLYKSQQLSKSHPDFWAARAAVTYNEPGITDRGIFSIYLLNLLKVNKGEAVFQDAGLPHAYLEGQNIEIMANSDNVLRGGLTNKHVDVAELMKHVKFEPTEPRILLGNTGQVKEERVFKTPARDFELSEIKLTAGQSVTLEVRSLDIFLILQGDITASSGEEMLERGEGQAFFATAGTGLNLTALSNAAIYRATVPYAQ